MDDLISIGYPDAESEREILISTASSAALEPVLSVAEVCAAQDAVEGVRVDPALVGYILDIAPGKSLVEHAVARGLQTFCISWYNPEPSDSQWGIDDYVASALEAIDAAAEITGSEELTTFASCAGGILTSILLGHMAASNDRRVRAAGFGVTMLDTSFPSLMGVFTDEHTVEATNRQVHRAGIIAGRDMAGFFTWLRPNELVWNYWVNNYLLGNDPPANDILFWNSDTTRLPARSGLVPVVGLYNRANFYALEASGGRPLDGVAEVRIGGRAID